MPIHISERNKNLIFALFYTVSAGLLARAAFMQPRDILISALLLIPSAFLAIGFGRRERVKSLGVFPMLIFCAVNSYILTQLLSLDRFSWVGKTESTVLIHIFGLLTVLFVYLLIYALTGKPSYTSIIGGGLFLVYGIINNLLYEFRGRPFLLIDIKSLKVAMSVAGTYKPEIDGIFIASIVFCIAAAILSLGLVDKKPPEPSRKAVTIARAVSAALSLLLLYSIFFTNLMQTANIQKRWTHNVYEESAVLNFGVTMRELIIEKPEGYSPDAVDKIISETGTGSDERESRYPTVIVILSEAFSDLRVFGELETNVPFKPFIDELKNSCVHGTAYSSVFGGNTANAEFEFLTGNSMSFLPTGVVPYHSYINYDTDTLVSLLKNQGYRTYSLHPYYPTGWNRNRVYERFGFDESYWIEDMHNKKYLRGYVTDKSNYDFLISLFEEKEKDERAFFFNITMQNHGSYTVKPFRTNVRISEMEGRFPKTEQYLSLISVTDEATKELIEYFSEVKEPVVILFVGDHQPKLDEEFYDYMYGGNKELSVEELERQYATEFFIWSNFRQDNEDLGAVSLNFLAQHLLKYAGLKTNNYGEFLSLLGSRWPVINAYGAMDSEGIWHNLEDEKFSEDSLVKEYKILQYNIIFDPKNHKAELFTPQ